MNLAKFLSLCCSVSTRKILKDVPVCPIFSHGVKRAERHILTEDTSVVPDAFRNASEDLGYQAEENASWC